MINGPLLGLQRQSAVVRELQSHVWGMHTTMMIWQMKSGIEHEDEAREAYTELVKRMDPEAVVIGNCGLWVNPKYTMLCCSPDGFLESPSTGRVLLEIKCLTMTYVDPQRFKELMPEDEQKNF